MLEYPPSRVSGFASQLKMPDLPIAGKTRHGQWNLSDPNLEEHHAGKGSDDPRSGLLCPW